MQLRSTRLALHKNEKKSSSVEKKAAAAAEKEEEEEEKEGQSRGGEGRGMPEVTVNSQGIVHKHASFEPLFSNEYYSKQ
jgi:hypothetical protein